MPVRNTLGSALDAAVEAQRLALQKIQEEGLALDDDATDRTILSFSVNEKKVSNARKAASDGFGEFLYYGEEYQETYCGEDAAVDGAHGWAEASSLVIVGVVWGWAPSVSVGKTGYAGFPHGYSDAGFQPGQDAAGGRYSRSDSNRGRSLRLEDEVRKLPGGQYQIPTDFWR